MIPALADVLQRPDIWRGDAIVVSPAPTLSSGFAELDAELPGGGWPCGQLTELLQQHEATGELTLLIPLLARLTRRGQTVVLVAPPHRVNAPAWAGAGVKLDFLRLLFPQKPSDFLWASLAALRCPEVAATLMWIDVRNANSLRRIHLAAGEGGGCAFLYRPLAAAAEASPAPLRLQLEAAAGKVRVTLLKRRGPPARRPFELVLPRPAIYPHELPHALAGGPPPVPGQRHSLVA